MLGLPFLVTLSRGVRYVMVQFVPKWTVGELANTIKMVMTLYQRAGFVCETASMDSEFEKVKQKLMNLIEVNNTHRTNTCPK